MSTVSAKDFFGGSVPTTKVPVVGQDSQLLEPTTHEQATAPNLYQTLQGQAPKPETGILGSLKGFGKSIADAMYAGKASKITEENTARHSADIQALAAKMKEMQASGQDTTHIKAVLSQLINEDPSHYGGDIAAIIPSVNKTKEQIIGEATGVLADTLGLSGGLSAATYGLAKGAGSAMENNKDVGGVTLDAAKGAIIGKVLDVGFQAVSPVIEKALEKWGTPLFDAISSHIPDAAKAGMKAIADGAQTVADKATIGSGTGGTAALDAVNAGVDKVVGAPFRLLGAGVNAVKDAAGNLVNKAIPQSAKENVARVLKNTGKKTLADAAGNRAIEDGTQALDIIRQNADNITIKDIDGIEKTFDPTKATFQEMPQALKQTKDAIYQQYTDLAKKAGDEGLTFGKKEFSTLDGMLEKYQGKGYTSAFASKAKSLQADLEKFGGKATPEELQKFIEQVNLDVNPLSDKAGAQVAGDFSRELRKMLDNKLEASGNPAYQDLRTQYSKLKSIEPDIIARYKEAMRKAGVSSDVIDHITNLDALYGLFNSSPAHIAASLGTKGVKYVLGYLKNPEVNLQRAFKILGSEAEKSSAGAATGAAKSAADEVGNDLSSSQGIFDHIQQNDGITVNPDGSMPTKGYSVAPSKTTETKIPLDKFSPADIEAFQKKFAKQLAKPDAHLGAWNDGENIVLDVSHVVNDFKSAIDLAKKGKQDAVYDIGNGKSIYTSDVLTPATKRKGSLTKELNKRAK